ncbi:hypothetical protein AB0B45_46665 [Nonomuraea sp. NPDC049152]|uniref:hypothetical protein n=1 Tax=Nonomuraea sp. NPDC049152 TaxID=3154350 RepID=UPI0033C0DE9F
MDSDAYYVWREGGFAVDILLDGDIDCEEMEVGDSIVTMPNGDRYSALLMTREEVSRVMDSHALSGESLGGSYFCTPDLIIIRFRGVTAMINVMRDIIESGEISLILPKISDGGTLDIPSM